MGALSHVMLGVRHLRGYSALVGFSLSSTGGVFLGGCNNTGFFGSEDMAE